MEGRRRFERDESTPIPPKLPNFGALGQYNSMMP